jgi:hypothetical protein
VNTLPKARLDKKSIDVGYYQQQYTQYQHQQESSETTTTAQDSQESTESFESQESQSSHSDSREDGNVTPMKSRQQVRQENQRQKQQAQKKEKNQKQTPKQHQASKPSIQRQHQQKKADCAVDDAPYFIDNGASMLSNSTYSSYRTLAGLDSLSGYPTQTWGPDMGALVQAHLQAQAAQQWSSPDLGSYQNSSLSALPPGFFDFANMGIAGPSTSSIKTGHKSKQGENPRFCPHCGNSIKPQFHFCPHCGNGLAVLQ